LDLALAALGPRLRAGVNAFTSLLMVVVCLVITWFSTKYTIYLFQNDVTIIRYYTIPKFTIYFIIPVGFSLLFIQSLKRTYQYLRQI
jgi:TRAP-type C4-dicarboxylate transport system permease small subunit